MFGCIDGIRKDTYVSHIVHFFNEFPDLTILACYSEVHNEVLGNP
jgi:hypothetical protein